MSKDDSNTAGDTATIERRGSGATSRLDNLRAQMRQIRTDSGYVVQDVVDLWPLVWRSAADRRHEDAYWDGVELGRYAELGVVAQRRLAPGVEEAQQ